MKRVIPIGLTLASLAMAQLQYTKEGDLVLPKDYRIWPFLSSGIGMTYSNDPNAHPLFSNVFVNSSALRTFLKTGTWPDKTILITEDRSSANHASNKEGKFQTDLVVWEAHVKDSSRGGWAFYVIRKTAQTGKRVSVPACATCHEKNAATDTTFVQFYPTLIDAAKKAGNFKDTGDVVMDMPGK